MKALRVLCVCSGGNIRSVSLAYLLKRLYLYDALAVGIKANSEKTIEYLCKWADVIITLEEEFNSAIPKKYRTKLKTIDVGSDIWHQAFHPQLMDKLYQGLAHLDFT